MSANTNATLSRVHRTAPERIYLCIGDDKELLDVDFSELAEITWSHDQPLDITITYVRADVAALAAAAQPPAAPQEELREDASYESMNLAVMVLSDCGHSSNYKPLLERVAGRIDRHVERLLTAQRADAPKAEPAQLPAGFVLVPTELAERVQETMGEFLMDHGWRQQDMDTSDEFGALLAAAPKAVAAPAAVAGPSDRIPSKTALRGRRREQVSSAMR